jgi:hypothetical protein
VVLVVMPKDQRPYYATRAELRAIDEGLAEQSGATVVPAASNRNIRRSTLTVYFGADAALELVKQVAGSPQPFQANPPPHPPSTSDRPAANSQIVPR